MRRWTVAGAAGRGRPVNAAANIFPLAIDAGGRFFKTAAGAPFLPVIDTVWCAVTQLDESAMATLIADLGAKKFNAVIVELVEKDFSTNKPANISNVQPFSTTNDFSTPNEPYFARVDYFINACKNAGILVYLWPVYTGLGAEGWDTIFEAAPNTTAKRQAWGDFLVARYQPFGNIIWVHGGDSVVSSFTPYNEYIARITAAWPSSIHTYHSTRTTRGRVTAGGQSWFNADTIYSDNTDAAAQTAAGWAASPNMPLTLVEEFYEGDTTDVGCLATIWQALCAGCIGGVAYGNAGIWPFPSGYASHLNDSGRLAMAHLANLMATIAWQKLTPVTDNTLVTTALGSGASAICPAKASDSTWGLIFTPGVGFTLNRAAFAGAYANIRIQRMNMLTGVKSDISASVATSGTQAITITTNEIVIVTGA